MKNKQYSQNSSKYPAAPHSDLYNLQPPPQKITLSKLQQLKKQAITIHQLFKDLSRDFLSQKQYYIISKRWFQRWKIYVSYEQSNKNIPLTKFAGSGILPQLNEDIVQKDSLDISFDSPYQHLNVALRDNLKQQIDYLIINQSIWKILSQYRHIQIKRFLQQTADGKKVEIHYRKFNAIYLFNNVLKQIQRDNVRKLKRVKLQLPQYKPVNQLLKLISSKIKQFANKECKNLIGSYTDFSIQPLKIWTVQQDLTQSKLIDNLHKGCKSNRSFSYKLYFPGNFIQTNNQQTISKLEISPNLLVVFQLKQKQEQWVFFNKNKFLQAKCDGCKDIKLLNIICACGYAAYCSKICKNKDKPSHRHRCERDAQSSQQQKQQQLTSLSKKGKMGLRNLGNTCFMNSGIQCLTSIKVLTQYFLKGNHLKQVNRNNTLGTKGILSDAYGKLIKKMYFGTEDSFTPSAVKRAIGLFQTMFSGYQQHDSGELISYMLDGLHEDLNRVKQKPYVQTKDYDGRQDYIVAKESWQNFLKRNQSIITDLMYGQFRSQLDCPTCKYKSITFDPFLMCPLPIPQNTNKIFQLTFIKDHTQSIKLNIPYQKDPNFKIQNVINQVALKLKVQNKMVVSAGSSYSCDYVQLQKQANVIRKQYKHKTISFRQLQAQQNINDEKIIIQHSQCHSQYGNQNYRRNITYQRIYLFNKKSTTKQIHQRIFKYYKKFLGVEDYQKQIIKIDQKQQKWRILIVTNSKYDNCYFCEKKGCQNCPLPYRDDLTLDDLLKKIKKSSFQHKFQLEIYWRKDARRIQKQFQKGQSEQKQQNNLEAQITIQQCFNLFEQPQTLQAQNQWYCPKCKQFVLAQKQLQIYKTPKILMISLKRFKNKGYKGLFQNKLSTIINFPINQLDISQYVKNHDLPEEYFNQKKSKQPKKKVLYELFAISNHYGSLGGGHYTAYCKKDNEGWYQYDDSSVSKINENKLVSSSSYILFYKRKE